MIVQANAYSQSKGRRRGGGEGRERKTERRQLDFRNGRMDGSN